MAIARTRPLAGPAPHPGEMLKDELEARGLPPPTRWQSRSGYRPRKSARSFAASGRLRRKPRCASPAISAARLRSGCAFRCLRPRARRSQTRGRRSTPRSRQLLLEW